MSIVCRSRYFCLIAAMLLTSCSPSSPVTDSTDLGTNSFSGQGVVEQNPTHTAPASESTSSTSAPEVDLSSNGQPEPSPTPSWVGPEAYPLEVNPLTGLRVSDPSLLDRRPVMIKVSNYPAYLRPHSGLSFADLIWEYYIGVGMTRFLALYYGEDAPQVGPVRSGRLVDPQLVRMYGGLLGLVGADPYVWDVIKEGIPGRYITEKALTCPALCRESVEHSVFANTSAFTQYARSMGLDNNRPDLEGTRFDPTVPEGGQRLTSLSIYISYYDQVGWDYDLAGGVYLRSQEAAQEDGSVQLEPLTDRLTGEQLAFENVVLLFTWHEVIKPELINMDLVHAERRRALILRDGFLYQANYSAVSETSPLRFYDQEGNPFPLKPGSTWFMLMGMDSTLEEVDQGTWKMRFYP